LQPFVAIDRRPSRNSPPSPSIHALTLNAAEENDSLGGLGTPMLQVLCDRVTDRSREGIRRRVASLSIAQMELSSSPVNIFQSKGRHFSSSKAVRHKEEQDRVVSFAYGRSPIYGLEHSPNFVPGDCTR
jgi:hypothetical protein